MRAREFIKLSEDENIFDKMVKFMTKAENRSNKNLGSKLTKSNLPNRNTTS